MKSDGSGKSNDLVATRDPIVYGVGGGILLIFCLVYLLSVYWRKKMAKRAAQRSDKRPERDGRLEYELYP